MKDFDFFQNLKLRVGYGTSGNNNVDNNMYATDYGSGHYGYNGSDYITLVPGTTLGNKKLKWEKTTTTNIGLDVSIFNSRVNLSVDWYNNESSNLLIKNKIPTSTGYTHQFQNIGSIRNRGVELVLNTTNIRTKDFSWTMDFNIAFNRSKVLDIYGDGETDNFIAEYESRMGFKIEEGKPLGQFFGLIYDGIYTTDDFVQNADGGYTLKDGIPYLKGSNRENVKPGDAKYKPTAGEVDSDGNPVWGTNDRTVIGNAAPDFIGGWNNTFPYRGLITEKQIDESLKKLFEIRFRLGMFNPDDRVPYSNIPLSVLECDAHKAHALKMARQSIATFTICAMQHSIRRGCCCILMRFVSIIKVFDCSAIRSYIAAKLPLVSQNIHH